MANVDAKHETVFDAGAAQSRLSRVYAEALLSAAEREGPHRAEELRAELSDFVRGVSEHPDVAAFLASPIYGKKAKTEAIRAALAGASELLRGLVGVLTQNNRLSLLGAVAGAYNRLLDERAGRVPLKVSAAVPLDDAQKHALVEKLKHRLRGEPVLDVRVDPDLLGGMVVQVGDSVIDTSVRSRLLSIRTLLLNQ